MDNKSFLSFINYFIAMIIFLIWPNHAVAQTLGNHGPIPLTPDRFYYHVGRLDNLSEIDAYKWTPVTSFDLDELKWETEFWVKISLPKLRIEDPAIELTAFLNGFEVYVNRALVYSYGNIPGKMETGQTDLHHTDRYYMSHIIPIPKKTGPDRLLLIRIFYKSTANIGEIMSLTFGEKSDVINSMIIDQKERFKDNLIDVFLGFLLFVTGTASLFVFLIRYRKRDYPFLAFGFFSFFVGLTYLSDMNPLFDINISPLCQHMAKSISFLLVPAGLFAFVETMFGQGPYRAIRRMWQFHLGFAMAAIILVMFDIDYTFFILGMMLFNCCTCVYIITKADSDTYTNLKYLFIAFFCLFILLLFLHFLEILDIITWNYDFFAWGMLIFVFALGYVLIRKYTLTFEKMQLVSLELEKNKSELLELQKENLVSQLEALKNQVNPHFLFNNLSTLTSIIEENQEVAVSFVQELSNVFRYVLQTRVTTLVDLKDELAFIQSYLYLMSKRFGTNLKVNLNIPSDFLDNQIIPFCLQLLIENAIKHNIVSAKKPLIIDIFTEDSYLTVKNNLQKKTGPIKSTHIGLANIKNRYRLITDKIVQVIQTEAVFSVKVPLIGTKS